ncbi:unnamed protein product [Ectocarpus sp. 4 AP-2014]
MVSSIARRESLSLGAMRGLSAAIMLLAVADQADGFYCAPGRVGGRASRCSAVSSSRKASSSTWSTRPTTTVQGRSRSGYVLQASSTEPRDEDAPEGDKVGADKKKGEGGGAEDAVLATSAESRTALLSKRVAEEGKTANKRAKRMANLSSQLKRSFAKKEEVETMITEEVAQLGTKLRQERDIEIARAADLKELLKEFDETIVEKQAEIEKEQDLLAQMQALRGQVDEASIRAPIETAMAKKADVTSIEVMLLEDLVECKEKLEEELKSTSARGETMNGVVAALPAEGDIARLRAYNWQDVQDLQEVLVSSAESMEASDAQVGLLRTRLLDSVQQKKEVLGEVSKAELVAGGGTGAMKMTTARAFQASTELSEEELLQAVTESSKNTALGVAKSVSAGTSSLGDYLRSPAGQDVAASTVLVIGALAGAAASVANAFKAAKKEFDENAVSGEELTSFDKILKSLQSSLKAVQESPAVKAELREAGDLLTKQVPQASARVGAGTAEAIKGAVGNSEISNPVKDALDSLEEFVVSLAALGTKYFTVSRAARFQLPGGSNETEEQRKANAKLPSLSPPPKPMDELVAQKSAAAAAAAALSSKREPSPAPAATTSAPPVAKPAAEEKPVSAAAPVSEASAPKASKPSVAAAAATEPVGENKASPVSEAKTSEPATAVAKPVAEKKSASTPPAPENSAPKAAAAVAAPKAVVDEKKLAPTAPASEVPAPKVAAPAAAVAADKPAAEKAAASPVLEGAAPATPPSAPVGAGEKAPQ